MGKIRHYFEILSRFFGGSYRQVQLMALGAPGGKRPSRKKRKQERKVIGRAIEKSVEHLKREYPWNFSQASPQLPCHRQSYGIVDCPRCGEPAYSHRYDATHSPWLVYGYEYHCHACGSWFQTQESLDAQNQYIEKIKSQSRENI